jgi:hypothetical protein
VHRSLTFVRERGADELAQSKRSRQIQTPSHPAARAIWGRYSVCEFLCSDHDWSWVLLEPSEEGLPVTKVPRSPQRLAAQWQQFFRCDR